MEKELREIAELTGELLGTLEGFWAESRAGALKKIKGISDETRGTDL